MADYVISTSGTAIVSLPEARRHLNLSTTDDDLWVESGIAAATRLVEDRTGRTYITQSRRLTMRTFADSRYVHGRRIYPQKSPILATSTVAITYVNSLGTTSTLPTSDYHVSLYETPGRISEAYNATWPDTRNEDDDVKVDYVAGASVAPPTVKHAVLMLLAHWYANREAVADKGGQEIAWGVDALLGSEMVERYG